MRSSQPLHIVRMVNPSAKVLFLHILQDDTVVIQHCLIHRQYGPIGSRHLYQGWDGVYCQTQIAFGRPYSLSSPGSTQFEFLSITVCSFLMERFPY